MSYISTQGTPTTSGISEVATKVFCNPDSSPAKAEPYLAMALCYPQRWPHALAEEEESTAFKYLQSIELLQDLMFSR